MSNFKTECRKFQPNIFNKIKCSNCFRQRDEHSAEALESNRSSRKVSKCGYLFVAPDWDFSNPLNRTKRWQRRWFVLYDDGELSYSVDDLPATIPQGVIDMNRVLEVSEAEDLTGNQFALAITSPDRATFVKGTCREESRWWRDVLSVFPRVHKSGRHKRNATFPGIKSSSASLQKSRSTLGRTPSPSLAPSFDPSPTQKVRFHNCSSDSFTNDGRPASAPTFGGQEDDVFPIKDPPLLGGDDNPDSSSPTPVNHSSPTTTLPSNRLLSDEHKENTPPYLQDYHDNPPTSESPPTQDKVMGHRPRTRRTAKREARGLVHPRIDLCHQLIISDLEESKRGEKLKDIADSLTRPRGTSSLAFLNKENEVKPTRESEVSPDQLNTSLFPLKDLTTDSSLGEQIRGDPDGCGLDGDSGRFRSVSDIQRVDLPAEDILYIKKGWLLKQGFSEEWSKHWFVLEGSGLKFYRDPGAEDNGILDGIIDLSLVKEVQEKEVGRNYGFVVKTWDDKKLVFSAVTCGIRTNWIQAMRNAANLSPPQGIPLTLGEKLEKEISSTRDTFDSSFDSVEAERDILMSSSSKTMSHSRLSSNEDFKTASDSSFLRELSRHDSTIDNDLLTPRLTSRSSPLTSRSRSSPPPPRRGSKDDFLSNSSNICLSEADSITSISMQDLERHLTPERDCCGALGSTGESMLMDLLETQVESLKAKLEQTQITGLLRLDGGIEEKNEIIEKIEVIRKQLREERKEWEGKLMIEENKVRELKASQGNHAEIVRTLSRSLQEAELQVSSLTQELSKVGVRHSVSQKKEFDSSLRMENMEVRKQVIELSREVSKLQETLKSEKSEVYKWKDLVKELRSLLDGRNDDMEEKREEVQSLRERLRQTQVELDSTADRLHRGIEENESLCNRLRELEGTSQTQTPSKVRRGSSNLSISSSREKFSSKKNLPRMDSLSDLTNFDLNVNPEDLEKESLADEYTDLRLRFEKAVTEIRALKREIRGAETLQDDMELTNQRLRAELQTQENDFHAQIQLMGTRVQDLTTKLNNSEKQVRSLKQKLTRTESKERRRTLSLKGRESFSLTKDLEAKLSLLEEKVASIFLQSDQLTHTNQKSPSVLKEEKRSKIFEDAAKKSWQRRKSLDGTPAEEDALKAIIRVNSLEERVSAFYGRDMKRALSSSLSSCAPEGNSIQGHGPTSRSKSPLISPLRSPASPRKMLSSRTTKLASDKAPKLTRSESEPKLLREKVSSLERVLSTVQAKLSECQTCTKTLECFCYCGSTSLTRLRELLTSTAHVAQFRHSQCDQEAARKVRPVALRLQDLLKDKMAQLVQRRHLLRASGKWTREAQLKCFAERLAFETTLLSQLAQALQAAQNPKSFEASLRLQELIEAHRKLSFLEKKLSNPEFDMEPMTPLEFYSSLLAEKLVIEGDIMGVMSSLGGNSKRRSAATLTLNETCNDLLNKVLEREKTLAGLVTQYKEEKLYNIAVVMARETVTGTQPSHADSVLLEELRLREAWGMAQNILTQEIIALETSQSVLRLSNLLVPAGSDFSCVVPQMISASLDRLQTGAEDSLRQEMEESVFTLSAKYEEVLSRYRSGDKAVVSSVEAPMEVVLGEFAHVIAQKALIDGQLAVATGDDSASTTDPLTIVEEKIDPLECAGDVTASESHLLMFLGGGSDPSTEGLVTSAMTQAEFAFIYNKVALQSAAEAKVLINASVRDATGSQKSLNSSASDRDIDIDASSFMSTSSFGGPKIPPSPKSGRRRVDTPTKSRRASDITGMIDNCRQCEELRQEVSRLKKSLEERRLRKQETECKKCIEYLRALKDLEEDHRTGLETLQSQHQGEIDRLRDQVKYDPPTRDSDDELTELKRRLCLLEEGYEAQIAALKKQYQEALGSQSDVCEENIRQRYQLEIEHLRELCEKGLTAMESSHRRLVSEMESKHRREMEALQAEKEEALAEETQATLAALDAMRKAHEAEVQKEVVKFKEEFLRRVENGREGEAEHSRLHEEEIRNVRREILQLSEKYSSKCLEMAAKEQKLESLQRQLTESKAQTRSLEERNRFLKQRLNTNLSRLQTNNTKSPEEIQHQHECELTLKDEEIAWLNQMLQKSKTHKSDLGSLCGQLGRFLKTEKSHRTDANTSVLRDKLETQIITAVRFKGKEDDPSTGTSHCSEFEKKDLEHSFNKEVSRSSSCPGLSRFSNFLWKGFTEPPLWSDSPLLGMVAQRKKVFEGPPTSKTEC